MIDEFLRAELPDGPINVGKTPGIAAVGTIAEIAVTNPLLQEPLLRAGLSPRVHLPFATPGALLSSTEWELALVISPYKQSLGSACTSLAPAAAATGVVDTLVRDGDRLIGLNTNAYAAAATLRSYLSDDQVRRVLLVGTGASTRSVAYALTRWYPTVLLGVYGRSHERSVHIADAFHLECVARPAEFHADVVIHATTVGETDDTVTIGPEVEAALRPGVKLFDLTNRLSALQATALARGCIVMSGNLMQRITSELRVRAISP